MTLLDVIDLDKIELVNSLRENIFFEPWMELGAASVWALGKKQN